MIKFLSFLGLIMGITSTIRAQNVPLGTWQTHFSYQTANTIDLVGDKIFTGSNHLVSYSLTNHDYTTYSKVNGMSDFNVKLFRYDASTNFSIIIYDNSNIDLMQGETFFNIPDIKNMNATGSKRINNVFFKNNLMYLATDFGIVVLNPDKKEIKETYILQNGSTILSIKDVNHFENYFYAATSNGIYKADENNSNLQNYTNWSLVNNTPINFILKVKDSLLAISETTIYSLKNSNFTTLYTSPSEIYRVRKGSNEFYICEQGDAKRSISFFDETGIEHGTAKYINAFDVVEVSPNETWEADGWYGMVKLINRTDKESYQPNGVFSNSAYSVKVLNDNLYLCGGAQSDWTFTYNSAGISIMDEAGEWRYLNRFIGTPALDSITDLVDVEYDSKTKSLYAASFIGGLLEFHSDKSVSVYKNNGYILPFGGTYRIANLMMDSKRNLWMSNYGADATLVVKKADNTWQNFKFPYSVGTNTASEIVIDETEQIWMVAPRGVGVYVLNYNNTIDNKNDDKIKFIQKGAGLGNLPSNEVNCITKDKDGKIWIGTTVGIAIINCPESIMTTNGCDAELKVVKYDLDAGQLFKDESVKTIAVDGANNKWIGTYNGVWQISNDAEKILARFTTENSPLPSNEINKIAIDPKTGVVHIATNEGLVSYRGYATDGNATNNDLLIYPNPVEPNYAGSIAIKGLVENADVRITDVSGQLIFRTKAQGGQAIWNGKNYLNQRPRTGVYYVFVTNEDGSETKTGKFIFNE